MIVERFDRMQHQSYCWSAIIIVRTAATNFADFPAGDLKLPRSWVMAGLLMLLVAAVWLAWKLVWQHRPVKSDSVLRADLGYWTSTFLAGRLDQLARAASLAAVLLGDGRCNPRCRDHSRRYSGRPEPARFALEHRQ